ncbi:restriction endonuclease [Solibacillus silvestris]
MANYDFDVLSPDEFELFSKDLLEVELRIKLENFKAGKDGGIDLRHAPTKDKNTIVQCKRYKSFSGLKSNLIKEVSKVEKLNPDKYILTTSVSLSPLQKSEIMTLFKGFIKSPGDIYGREQLQSILQNNATIERKHYKLWLSSTNVLRTILHNEIYNRSKYTESQLKEKIRLFVPNESYEAALKHLEKNKVIIISGGPGVGKTTLADMLYVNFSSQGYEFIEISADIDEGEKLFNEESKQLFYFDDFLGRNFLNNGLARNEEKRIVSFIKKIMKSENKVFIMTTREYILNQAKIEYDVLDEQSVNINKFVLDVESYTSHVKAKILYNHLYFSNLPEPYIKILISEKTYKAIIIHENYNPRLISRMTSEWADLDLTIEEYPKYFLKELDYPYSIWQHIYENQISEYSRWILSLLMIMGDKKVEHTNLEINFESLNLYLNRRFDINAYKRGLKELESTFISIDNSESNINVSFQNPSIVDFLIDYNKNLYVLEALWQSSKFLIPMLNIFSFREQKGKINLDENSKQKFLTIMLQRFNDFIDTNEPLQRIKTLYILNKNLDLDNEMGRKILLPIFIKEKYPYCVEYLELLFQYRSILEKDIDIQSRLVKFLENTDYYTEFEELINVIVDYPEVFNEMLDEQSKKEFIDTITSDVIDYAQDYEYEGISLAYTKYSELLNIDITETIKEIEDVYNNLEIDDDEFDYYEKDDRDVDALAENADDYLENLFETLLEK